MVACGRSRRRDVTEELTGEDEIRAAIAERRRALAGVLAGLTDAQWDAPTLCHGWRVRELVVHLTMAFRWSTPRFVWEMVRARGSFGRMCDVTARRDAATLSTAELTAAVADNVDNPWHPPGGGYLGALTHDTVHGLDVTVPLGLDVPAPAATLAVVLSTLCGPRSVKHFGLHLDGVELRATDLAWTHGSGEVVTGTAQDLVLAISGREAAGVPGLAARLRP